MPTENEPSSFDGAHILLGVTGSIAAYKSAELVRHFKKAGAEVQVLMSPDADRFVTPLTLGTLSERDVAGEIFPENAPDGGWTEHVTLGGWGDVLLIAPASASSIASLATGDCDSMLTAVALSARCPVLVAPAMDRDMYAHPAVQSNLDTLRDYGYHVLEPETGELASGLHGQGRLPELNVITDRTAQVMAAGDGRDAETGAAAESTAESGGEITEERSLEGRTVLVTAGPTREPIDPVRFISNPSTGTTGFALAAEAARRGADVTLITGPSPLDTPPGVRRLDVVTTEEMHRAVEEHAGADLVFMSAAVADYRPKNPADQKIKKDGTSLSLELEPTVDILAELGAEDRPGQVRIGFALETDRGPENAREKLEKKNLDLIVLNDPTEPGAGFGPDTNRVTLIGPENGSEELPMITKRELAAELLDRASRLLQSSAH